MNDFQINSDQVYLPFFSQVSITWTASTPSQLNAFQKQDFFLKSKVPIIILQTPDGMEINLSVKTLDFTIASSDNI